jgi:hypothetical protein
MAAETSIGVCSARWKFDAIDISNWSSSSVGCTTIAR